jgi:hypothetical protein
MRALTSGVVVLVFAVTGWSFAQPGPDKAAAEKNEPGKKSLEDLLATALRHSPDVQVAQAKVREAEAELRRTRLTLLQKVIEANSAVEATRVTANHSEAMFRRLQQLSKAGQVPMEELQKAEAQMATAKAELARAEGMLNALTGLLPGGVGALTGREDFVASVGVAAPGVALQPPPVANPNNGFGGGVPGMLGGMGAAGGGALGFAGGGMGAVEPPRMPRGTTADKLRGALDSPVKIEPVKDKPLAEVLRTFRGPAKGVPFLLHLGEKANEPISLSLEGDVQLGAAFQALEDVVPGLKCYVREYGILITTEDSAVGVQDGVGLVEFWRPKNATGASAMP